MNGITFLNASYWPWLLALGIPVLIHLLTRQTRHVTALPTFRFLQRSLAQQSRIFLLRRWLLLALRLLLLFFLVLTFLKPTLIAPLANTGGEKRALILVLDTSLSMGYNRGGVSSLARAKAQAGSLLDDLRQGDQANVILAASVPAPVLEKPGSDFGTLRESLKSATVTAERGDLPAAISLAIQQLTTTNAARKELVLASDFQRSNWGDAQFDGLPAEVKLLFLNSDGEERDNTAVQNLKLRPSTPRAEEEATVVAEVWNGTRSARTLTVALTVEGERGGRSTAAAPPLTASLTLPPYASGTAAFPVTFPEPGSYRLMARVPEDSLPADDTRTLAADLRHSLTVLLLTDAPLSGESGAYFLLRALNPTPEVPGGARVLPRRATELTEMDLKTCDVVVLNEVTTLPADRMPLLFRYITEGGSLLAFLSGTPAMRQMEALSQLAKGGEGLPFLPRVPMDVRRQGKGYISLTEARYDSTLLKIFKDPEAADLGKIRFTRFFLTGEPDPRAEVLLKYEDSTPAAARRNLGAGSVLLCNFSPAPADSDLARQEVFPPLVHEFLKGLTAKEGERREFTPGGVASATLDAGQSRGKVTALGPNGEAEKVTVDRTGGGVIVERVNSPGFHTILADGQAAALLAVNPHPDESDLRTIDPRELESRRRARSSYLVGAQGANAAAQLEGLRRSRPLWPYFLLAAFAALLLEHLVATFGSRVRIRPRPENGRQVPD